ncbi:RnfABCDGE type electron transport complex subunit G [bacterium]|nr:RnfABCDGE type electron transport complex subunit G [bacterium]
MRDIGRLVLVLVVICSLSAASLSYVRTSLATRIEQQGDYYVRGPALARLFQQPASQLLANKVKITRDGTEYPVFFRKDGDQVTGLAVEAAGQGGYGGPIVMMIGIDLATDTVLGVEIVSHSETPGLGAQVEKAGFRQQWVGLPLGSSVALAGSGGSVDAITGATFSSSAMVDGTNQVLDLMNKNRAAILAEIAGR